MKRLIQFALCGVVVAVLAGLAVYHLSRASSAPRPHGPLADPDDTPAKVRAITGRMERKRQVAVALIAGRGSLLEAAAAFRDLDMHGPPPPPIRAAFPGAGSEAEAYCLCVLDYVGTEAPPGQAGALTRRFQEELEARLRDGTLRLPEAGEH
jgi:hypothetical protein